MRILIVSDTHGINTNLLEALEREEPVNWLLHLGDLEGSERFIENTSPCPVTMVAGNNDFFTTALTEAVIKIGKYKVFLTHGHKYGVSYNLLKLKMAARERGCQMAMFGHTHRPCILKDGDITFINPGSLSYPRQTNRKPSYIIMEANEDGEAAFTLRYI